MSRTMRVTSGKALLAWSRVKRRRALEGLAPDVENCGAAIGAAFLECAACLQTLLGAIMPSTEGLSNAPIDVLSAKLMPCPQSGQRDPKRGQHISPIIGNT